MCSKVVGTPLSLIYCLYENHLNASLAHFYLEDHVLLNPLSIGDLYTFLGSACDRKRNVDVEDSASNLSDHTYATSKSQLKVEYLVRKSHYSSDIYN